MSIELVPASAHHSPAAGVSGRRHPVLPVAAAAAGAGCGAVSAWDGSPFWQLGRLVIAGCLTAALVATLARARGVARAGLSFTVGCAAIAVGVGIGLPHLMKAGWHGLTVAGLLAAGAGLVLAGVGGMGLVRRSRHWARVFVVPGLLVAAAVSLLTLGQAVAATNVPRTSVGASSPASSGLTFRDVEFRTSDDVTLSGWYVPSRNGAAVVLLHGAGSTRASVLDHAVVLARHGYGVVLFDARGHGRSGGRAMDFGWYGDEDVAAAVTFLEAQADVVGGRIAAVGMSMGGEEAIGATAADRRLRAVVAEGATGRVAGDKGWLSEELGWRGALQEGLDWLTYALVDLFTAADRPVRLRDAVAAAAPRPVLLVTAGSVPDEAKAAKYIQEGSPTSVGVWNVAGTGHTAGLDTHPREWESRVATFLAAALRPTGPTGAR